MGIIIDGNLNIKLLTPLMLYLEVIKLPLENLYALSLRKKSRGIILCSKAPLDFLIEFQVWLLLGRLRWLSLPRFRCDRGFCRTLVPHKSMTSFSQHFVSVQCARYQSTTNYRGVPYPLAELLTTR